MTGLNEFLPPILHDLLLGWGGFALLLLLIRFLPDFARNLTLLLASLAAIEIFTSPFFTFGMVAVTGLVYYGIFWLQWNDRKQVYCRLISASLLIFLAGILTLFRFLPALSPLPAFGAVFLAMRLIRVSWSVGQGHPLPSDPLEFFVYAFFFPTFFLGPLDHLDAFRKNLTSDHRPPLSWPQAGLGLGRTALGLVKIALVVRFLPLTLSPLGAAALFGGLSGCYDLILGSSEVVGFRISENLGKFPVGTLVTPAFLFAFVLTGVTAVWIGLAF